VNDGQKTSGIENPKIDGSNTASSRKEAKEWGNDAPGSATNTSEGL